MRDGSYLSELTEIGPLLEVYFLLGAQLATYSLAPNEQTPFPGCSKYLLC